MQILHRITINSSPEIRGELAILGIEIADHGLVTFEVDESMALWTSLQEWILRRRPVDISSTTFTRRELSSALVLELVPEWHHGFPQPDDGFSFLRTTFDLTNWCSTCGIGKTQVAPFQMKREPQWGRRGIMQLNWVFDEYFVTPSVWESVFKALGIGRRPVVDSDGAELRSVVQLVADIEVDVLTKDLPFERCEDCHREKYLPVTRGPFPPVSNHRFAAYCRSVQYFGSGGQADRRVVVSQATRQALLASNVKGASFRPVART